MELCVERIMLPIRSHALCLAFRDQFVHVNAEQYIGLRSGADSMGHGGHVPPLLQMAGQGGTVSRRTANQKLTKLY